MPDKSYPVNQLQQINEYEFEKFVADVWSHRGWETRVTQGSADKGIDVTAEKEFPYEEKLLIQAKRYGPGSKVGSPEMQKYASLAQRDGVDKVLIVCTSGFTAQAEEVAQEFGLKLIDGRTLAQIIDQAGLEDLVREYAGEIDDAQIDPPTSDTPSSDNTEDSEDTTLFAEGEYLTIGLTGLTYSDRFNYTVATFEIYNKADSGWKIDPRDLTLISQEGFSYSPEFLNIMEDIPSGWSMVYEDIRPDTKIRYLAAFDAEIAEDVQRIDYEVQVHKRLSGSSSALSSLTDSSKDVSFSDMRKRTLQTETIQLTVPDDAKHRLSIPDSLPIEDIYIE